MQALSFVPKELKNLLLELDAEDRTNRKERG